MRSITRETETDRGSEQRSGVWDDYIWHGTKWRDEELEMEEAWQQAGPGVAAWDTFKVGVCRQTVARCPWCPQPCQRQGWRRGEAWGRRSWRCLL